MESSHPYGASPLAGTRYGGLLLHVELAGAGELEAPLYRATGEDGASLVVAPLRLATAGDAGEPSLDRIAALYDRALRLAHVEHPALPPLVESMAPELPDPFLAWSVPAGETVRSLLARGTPPLVESARLVCAAAAGLEALHAAGEVHGGLSPANVLATGDGVQLLGVGVATPLLRSAPAAVARYRAPEQLAFVRGAIDRRTDVFALGALLYELVNDAQAFPGGTLEELRRSMSDAPPASLGHRFTAGELPAPLARALAGALRPQPNERLRSAEELRRLLEELLAVLEPGGAIPARSSSERATPSEAAHPPRPRPRRRLARPLRDDAGRDDPFPWALWLVPAALLAALVAILVLSLR